MDIRILLLALIFAFNAQAQTQVFKVDFSKQTISNEFDLTQNNKTKALSAYSIGNNAEEPTVYYRVYLETTWGEWTRLAKNTEGNSERLVYGLQEVVSGAKKIQFKLNSNYPNSLNFRLYTLASSALQAIPQNTKEELKACTCPMPSTCIRACWCPDGSCPPNPQPTLTEPTHIIIHHSAGFTTSSDFKTVVASYWDFHVNTNGWSDIAYNWLIDPNGVIYDGRGEGVLGAHFSCTNTGTLGICFIGDYQNTAPSEASLASLTKLLAAQLCKNYINPLDSVFHQSSQLRLPTVCSHRDGNASPASNSCASGTVCPGEELYAKLEEIRQHVANETCLLTGIDVDNIQVNNWQLYAIGETWFIQFSDNTARKVAIYTMDGRLLSETTSSEKQLALNSLAKNNLYLIRVEEGARAFSIKLSLP